MELNELQTMLKKNIECSIVVYKEALSSENVGEMLRAIIAVVKTQNELIALAKTEFKP